MLGSDPLETRTTVHVLVPHHAQDRGGTHALCRRGSVTHSQGRRGRLAVSLRV
jgi:hypothetical protein